MFIELGSKVRDTVTGFVGVAVARTEWLNGCTRYNIQGPVDKDGKVPDQICVDHQQLKVVEDAADLLDGAPKKTGGPAPMARQERVPAL